MSAYTKGLILKALVVDVGIENYLFILYCVIGWNQLSPEIQNANSIKKFYLIFIRSNNHTILNIFYPICLMLLLELTNLGNTIGLMLLLELINLGNTIGLMLLLELTNLRNTIGLMLLLELTNSGNINFNTTFLINLLHFLLYCPFSFYKFVETNKQMNYLHSA